MNIAIIHTRLFCIDGVSLEALKWIEAYERLGHKVFLIAGHYDEEPNYANLNVPEIDYSHEKIKEIKDLAFKQEINDDEKKELLSKIRKMANFLKPKIKKFIEENKIDVLSVENAFSIPINLPLGVALKEIVEETGIKTICRHHDYAWERVAYTRVNNVPAIVDEYFPPDLPNIRHISINKSGKRGLKRKRGLISKVFYNAFDFTSVKEANPNTSKVRKFLGVADNELLFLQPTRIVKRKKIERTIKLISEVQKKVDKKCVLVVTGTPLFPKGKYLRELKELTEELNVKVIFGMNKLDIERDGDNCIMDDAYLAADMITFPSSREGFGDPVFEACMYKKPLFVNRYRVLREILKQNDFDFISIFKEILPETVDRTVEVLTDSSVRTKIVEHNYKIAKENFSINALVEKLRKVIESF